MFSRALGRWYFAAQASAGALWWACVFTVPAVRRATLGELDPVLIAALDLPLFVGGSVLAAFGLRWAVWVVVPWTGLVAAGMASYATLTGIAGWGALAMIAAAACSIGAGIIVRCGRVPTERLLVGPFAFGEAARATRRNHIARTGRQIALFWGCFLGLLPVGIALIEARWGLRITIPPPVAVAGGSLFVAASSLGIWSALAMSAHGEGTPLPAATARRLVVAGPYRWVRNPMALAGVAQAVGIGCMLGSWLVIVYALAGSLIWNWVVRPSEEADLRARFGADFDAFEREVACWLPRRPSARGPLRRDAPNKSDVV
ncbi:isoprenylcysteine carboxylmethyltransferase family protein [Leucobacter sp. NPDC077196]|uniref:methyltransferase family protein n=1 Tax=Leucobacter sp. NPDC077196 TaxID=3154959 RepID=UPI00344048A3